MREKIEQAIKELNKSGMATEKVEVNGQSDKELAEAFMDAFETISDNADVPESFGKVYQELVDQYEGKTGLFEVKASPSKKASPSPEAKEEKTTKGKVKEMKVEKREAKTVKKVEKKEVKKEKAVAKKTDPVKKETVKEKAKTSLPAKEIETTSDGRKMWAKGSSAQVIMDAIIAAKKTGIESAELEKLKFESSNKKSRVVVVTREAIKRGLAEKKNNKLLYIS